MLDLQRFKNPALQFSGGKDSLACLYLLREQLPELTVYFMDAGDGCPETLAVVEEVKDWVPNFVTVRSDVKAWRKLHGNPSDLVAASSHYIAEPYGISTGRLSNRFDCCAQNIMRPLHERMVADGVDCVIRGIKTVDTGTIPFEGRDQFYEVILPIRDWTHDDVFKFLETVGAPHNAIYDFHNKVSAPACIGCTAWWDDAKAAYLRKLHPERLTEYHASLEQIKHALQSHLEFLDFELRS
jgi:3'-phosphoadenosine 5'-phosphosulfate sulfotransferase (PAPS reductase)/FAD synthetase